MATSLDWTFMVQYRFVQTVKEPTTDGGTLLDHIYVSKLEVNSI